MACNSCSPNTLFITQPTKRMADECSSLGTCGQGLTQKYVPFNNPVAFCSPGGLGPRKNREKVREQIKTYVLAKLGAPVIKLELDDQQVDIGIEYALQVFEDYAPREYFNYYVFQTTPGKSVYTLPPDIGLVRNVFYKEQPGLMFNASDLGGVLPLEYYYPGGAYSSLQGGLMDPNQPIYGRMGEWTLYKMYEQMYSRLSSQIGGWEFVGGPGTNPGCAIKLYPIPCRCQWAVVHYLQKRPDFKEVTQAMMDGALWSVMEILGRIRSKYTQIPGPSGGVQLDGAALIQEAKELRDKWIDNLIVRWGDLPYISMD